MNFDDIQSSCENKGSEEMEAKPLPNHTGLANEGKLASLQCELFKAFEMIVFRLYFIDDDLSFLDFWPLWGGGLVCLQGR